MILHEAIYSLVFSMVAVIVYTVSNTAISCIAYRYYCRYRHHRRRYAGVAILYISMVSQIAIWYKLHVIMKGIFI